jgi:putative transposase
MNKKGFSQRRACALAGMDPRVYRRQPTRPEDIDLRKRLKERKRPISTAAAGP